MCGFIEWLGWNVLTPKEQWEHGLEVLGIVGALVAFLWTVNQWLLAKKIEFEISILTSIEQVVADSRYFRILVRKLFSGRKDELGRKEEMLKFALNREKEVAAVAEQIQSKSLSFIKLRKLNKNYYQLRTSDHVGRFIDNFTEIILERHSEGSSELEESLESIEEIERLVRGNNKK